MSLHMRVRDALAHHATANGLCPMLVQADVPETLTSELGTPQLRRLVAFYAFGEEASGVDHATVHEDLQWLKEHFDDWVTRQVRAQRQARQLVSALRSRFPLDAAPPPAGDPARQAELLRQAAQRLRATPNHWARQPWAERLFGKWTEDLPATVAEAQRWLDQQVAIGEVVVPERASDAGE